VRLLEARESSIRAVVIDGRVRLGEAQGLVIGSSLSSEKVSIGGKEYVLDLAEPGDGGVGGMKLSEALEKIRYGLEHLPDFETTQKERLALMGGELGDVDSWRLEDEMHSDSMSTLLFRDDTLPARPMNLAPMTAVDDTAFNAQMRASVNMPEYAKAAFID
jgi:5-methylthioadenosine/S-adenosylhomocysteine deaminase